MAMAMAMVAFLPFKTNSRFMLSPNEIRGKVRSPSGKSHHGSWRPIINSLNNASTFSSSLSTDLPLRDFSQAPFDLYISDRDRVFEAIFPDKQRAEKINEDEWRIQMLPLDIFFLSVRPVIDMRIVLRPLGEGLPIQDSQGVKRVLSLEATRWELRGLGYTLKPSDFNLNIKGSLYCQRKGLTSRLKGHLQMSVAFVLPPSLELIPPELLKAVGEAVLVRLLQSMKDKVNGNLMEDYRAFANDLLRRSENLQQQSSLKSVT